MGHAFETDKYEHYLEQYRLTSELNFGCCDGAYLFFRFAR
jgi:hypothetical protein